MAARGGGSDDEAVDSGGGLAERREASAKMGTLRTGLRDLVCMREKERDR